MKKTYLLILIIVAIMTVNIHAVRLPESLESVAGKEFKGIAGAMVIYDLKADRYSRYNTERCAQRFAPKSTFKIPNSLFALETGVLKDINTVIPWDKKRDPKKPWWDEFGWAKDHTLRTGIKYSVVWFYQEVARRIGRERMQKLVDKVDYGNRDISGPIDRFWLNGTIKISADEQIRFLKKYYLGKLGFSKETTAAVKEIMIREKTDEYTFSAKTGGGDVKNGHAIGWYVGYVEREGNVYFFALNIDGSSFESIRAKRIEITRSVAKALGII